MGKGHRDNHAARVKRGPAAFAKKAQRRHPKLATCTLCGRKVRPILLKEGLCPAHIGGYISRAEAEEIVFSMMTPPEGFDRETRS
jgi:hypothetical protein